MPPSRKNISTISKSSISINEQHSPIKSTYECGSVVWCKYKKYPYWPGIIWKKVTKPSRILYEVLFFGTLSIGLEIDCKWLEPYKGLAEFKQRIAELKATEIRIKNKPSQYDMNITLAKLESYQEGIKQASKVLKCSNSSERLELADNMRKGILHDIFQLEVDDDEENEDKENEEDDDENKEEHNDEKNEEHNDEEKEEDNDEKNEEGNDEEKEEGNDEEKEEHNDEKNKEDTSETNLNVAEDNTSILPMPQIPNDQQFIQTMIIDGRKKRTLEEDDDLSIIEIRRIKTKNEPEQPSMNHPLSVLFRHSIDQPIVMCSNFVCHSLSPTEEILILNGITRSGPDCTFFQAKQIAEEIYSHIICLNNSNSPLPVSEIWFYIFFNLHFEQLFSTHPHWLGDLEKTKTNINYVNKQQQQLILQMKAYLR